MIPSLSVGRGLKENSSRSIFIVVPGDPAPKGRPRARIVTPKSGGQFIHFYTPKETEAYEAAVKWCAKSAMAGNAPLDCPLEAVIRVFIGIPASWSKKKHTAALRGDIRHITKPDLDNVEKLLLDAMNGVVYIDDNRVWKRSGEKHYSDTPRVEIEIIINQPKETDDA